ncbi:MAG: LuxR C-terminal-related transcriptional regulator [Ilumatobacter fluminis]|uniref:helix-turn-helix transcriptional regulator n=1 Tax=Ilumatobacter fluminis TaxID=467091 RepID=UPI0032EB632B
MDVVGRDEVIGEARAVLARGAGALAVVGPAGSGVSAVLAAVADEAQAIDRPLVTGAGRPAEQHVPAALLRELATGDEALATVIRGVAGGDGGGYAIAVFEWASAGRPVALIVDDLHLADGPSGDAITHLARRAELTSVTLVIGTHDAVGLDGVTTIELTALSADDLIAVLEQRVGSIDPSVARAIAQLAEGSPLVAVEVARSLDDAQRRGTEPLPSFAAVAAPIRHAFAHGVEGLPDDTRRALCLAAAEPTGEVRVIAAALRSLGDDLAALEPAEDAGIVTVADGEVVFDHPIRRSVAYHQLAPASRRGAHRALAAVLDAPQDAERRLAHLVAGVIEPNESLASDLEFAAEAAERRRDALEARRWWLAASRLSPDSGDAERRRHRADAAGSLDGDPLAALTKAERRVAAVVGSGATNKATAETLYVSVKTVDAHLQSIYRKLAISSRAELAVLVTQAGLAGAGRAG